MRLAVPSRIGSNWPIKVTALGLATVLWAAVSAEEPTTQLVPIRLDIQTPTTKTLLQDIPPIRGLYAGSARELIKLLARHPQAEIVHLGGRREEQPLMIVPTFEENATQ